MRLVAALSILFAACLAALTPGAARAHADCGLERALAAVAGRPADAAEGCPERERHDRPAGDTEHRTTAGHGEGGRPVGREGDDRSALNRGGHSQIGDEDGGRRPRSDSSVREGGGSSAPAPGRPGTPSARTASGRRAPTAYVHPVAPTPPPDAALPCLSANPSCGRDPWWSQWSEPQGDEPTQFAFLSPGFVAEARFVEAVRLLWTWPEGAELLRSAADRGVLVVTSRRVGGFAGYAESERSILVNRDVVESPTWMLADVLAHELRHAADRGSQAAPDTAAECVAGEQVAYRTEQRFLGWLETRFGTLPTASMVSRAFSSEDRRLYRKLHDLAASTDVDAEAQEDYGRDCARRFGRRR